MRPSVERVDPISSGIAPWPDAAVAWWVTSVTFLAFTLAHIDRQLLSLLIRPIEQDLHLSDAAFGALQGLAFALFYTCVGIPMGYLADRLSRRGLIAACIFTWCAMTALTGYARSFTSLFIARIGVGAGEGGLAPSAYSLISDLFPHDRLAFPTGVFVAGNYIGSGLALILGGRLLLSASYLRTLLPGGGIGLSDWQIAFIAVGIPGLVLVPLSWTFREPLRRSGDYDLETARQSRSVRDSIRFMWSNRRLYTLLILGISCLGITAIGTLAWLPGFLMRAYGWDEVRVGTDVGLIYIAAGLFGTVVAGVADRTYYRRRGTSPAVKFSMLCAAGTLPMGLPFAAPQLPPWVVLGAFGLSTVFVAVPFALIPTALQLISPNWVRGQVSAVYALVLSIVGIGLGPTAIGVVSDELASHGLTSTGANIGVAIALTGATGGLLSFLLFRAGAAAYRNRLIDVYDR